MPFTVLIFKTSLNPTTRAADDQLVARRICANQRAARDFAAQVRRDEPPTADLLKIYNELGQVAAVFRRAGNEWSVEVGMEQGRKPTSQGRKV